MIRTILLSCALLGLGACSGSADRSAEAPAAAYVPPAAPHKAPATLQQTLTPAGATPACCEAGGGRAALLTRGGTAPAPAR